MHPWLLNVREKVLAELFPEREALLKGLRQIQHLAHCIWTTVIVGHSPKAPHAKVVIEFLHGGSALFQWPVHSDRRNPMSR
jgi:hypothetical protein